MPTVEQTAVIKAPMAVVMACLNDVEKMPSWATVSGSISNVQGQGAGMTYEWRYTINGLAFNGHSQVMEQTESRLITKTSGDVNSIWTVTLNPAGKNSTVLRVVVEYTLPSTFVEVMTDIVLQQLGDPDVARQNMTNFKQAVEARLAEEQVMAGG